MYVCGKLTPVLIRSVENNNIRIVKALLEQGQSPHCHLGDFKTPLHIAAARRYYELTEVLLNSPKIKIDAIDNKGQTPLMKAVKHRYQSIVDLLLRYGANINHTDHNGYSSLHYAVLFRYNNLVRFLLEHNANVKLENVFAKSPLYLACVDVPNMTAVKFLLDYGADINYTNNITMPILLECCLNCLTKKKLKFIERLIYECDADVNIMCQRTYRTALHIAAITGYIPLVSVLCSAGCDYNLLDSQNRTAQELAIYMKNEHVSFFMEFWFQNDSDTNVIHTRQVVQSLHIPTTSRPTSRAGYSMDQANVKRTNVFRKRTMHYISLKKKDEDENP